MTDTYTTRGNTGESTGFIRDRSPATVDFDNLIRRKLRVSDPNNQEEIAEALGKLYVTKRREMDAEASGLAFMTVSLPFQREEQHVSSTIELDQAKNDVDRDLTALINNSLLKDIQPELSGWASAIHTAIADGINAARFSLDPRQRDKTFAVRRMLGDYARIARYVGAMTPTLSLPYRRLAQSLDEVSAVLLIMIGEALANIGFSGGNFILQIPLSELQERRDAVIYALQNLNGTKQHSGGNTIWPRGLVAYRQFIEKLSRSAHHDIRALLQENEIARTMDDLIDRASGTTALGLRALGATAQPTLERFRRLIRLGHNSADPKSPPFTAFLEALGLFLAAFENSRSGYRILAISRPSAVYYGLYGIGAPDAATQRLQRLIIERGRLAELLDCYLGCECDCDKVYCQIILDKILYDVDRAIDLYALGTEDAGVPEKHAAAYGLIIHVFLGNGTNVYTYCLGQSGTNNFCKGETELKTILESIKKELCLENGAGLCTSDDEEMMRDELCMQYDAELNWLSLLKTMAPSCIRFSENKTESCMGFSPAANLPTCDIINKAIVELGGDISECKIEPFIPGDLEDSTDIQQKTITKLIVDSAIAVEPEHLEFKITKQDINNEVHEEKSLTIRNIGETTLGPILIFISQPGEDQTEIISFTFNTEDKNTDTFKKMGSNQIERLVETHRKLIVFDGIAKLIPKNGVIDKTVDYLSILEPNQTVKTEIKFQARAGATTGDYPGGYTASFHVIAFNYDKPGNFIPETFCSASSELKGVCNADAPPVQGK